MATLERNPFLSTIPQSSIDTRVPEPFPIDVLQRERDRSRPRPAVNVSSELLGSTQIEEPGISAATSSGARNSEESVELPETVLDTVQGFNVSQAQLCLSFC